MGNQFWIQRFAVVCAAASSIIGGVHWAKGHTMGDSVTFGLAWGAASAAIFVAGRLYRSRRGQDCAICRDTPAVRSAAGSHPGSGRSPSGRLVK